MITYHLRKVVDGHNMSSHNEDKPPLKVNHLRNTKKPFSLKVSFNEWDILQNDISICHFQIQFISKNMFSLKKQPYFLLALDR